MMSWGIWRPWGACMTGRPPLLPPLLLPPLLLPPIVLPPLVLLLVREARKEAEKEAEEGAG